MVHPTEIKVRGYHADFYGHVNNARFLEFLEEDRWAHLESKMNLRKLAQNGLVFLVVNININYRKAVPVGATLVVMTMLEKIGSRSAVFKQEIVFKESGETAADALVTFVFRDKSGKAVAMTGALLKELAKFEKSPAYAGVH